jgi:predicted alpha/beta-hydrolase family hydrolase
MQEAALTVTTSRGAKVDAIADFPAGPGPFAAIVLAPGQGYHMTRPALEQTARRLVAAGVAVYRFNWAYSSADPKAGAPSTDLADELQDLSAVLATALAQPRVRPGRLCVGGKSLGSVVAWRAFAADRSLCSGLFLTPICSHVPKGQSDPICIAQENYPGLAAERRPLLFIAGDRDPWCAPALLQRLAASAGGGARVAIVGGDHSFDDAALTGAASDEARTRNLHAVADIAASFIAQASGG